MSDTYLTWDAVETRLKQFWQESYPREKIIEIKQTKKDLEFGTEKAYDSLISYQHVYYYGDVTVTKPNGAKYLYPLRIAFYQVTGQPQWNFHYASPGNPTVLEEAKGEDPMKISPEKARDLFKKYIDLMMQKFPSDKWKDYCKTNGVDVKITKIDFSDLKNELYVFDNIRYEDPDASFRVGFLVEGQYKDNASSFNFRLKSVYANFYMNLKEGYWTISGSRDLRPIEKTELKDCRDFNDKLFDTQQEPRTVLEQYIPEPSPRDNALAMMRDSDPGKRRNGVDSVKWIQGFADDEEIIDVIANLLVDSDKSVVNYAKSILDVAASKATTASAKDKIKAALEGRAKADVAGAEAAKAGAEAEKETQYAGWIADLQDPSKAGSALNFLRTRWGQRILGDDNAMDGVIGMWVNGKSSDARSYLDSVRSYDKDKVSPSILQKINGALGVPKAGPADKASSQAATSAQQVDEYVQAVANLKDKTKAGDAIKKLKTSKYLDKILPDDSAMSTIVDIWLKKDAYDSNSRSEARAFMDNARSYNKTKLSAATLKKIEDAFKAVRF